MKPKKVVIIGAGSTLFTQQLLTSMFSYPALTGITVTLEECNEEELEKSYKLACKIIEQEELPAKVNRTTNQRQALKDADFVINTVAVGGNVTWDFDIGIPAKYGVDLDIGDTLGPGGIFRGLRHIPVVSSILDDMEKLCPNALFMNYSNPNAAVTWGALEHSNKIKSIGLCYGHPATIILMAGYLGVLPFIPFEDFCYEETPEKFDDMLYMEVPKNIDWFGGGINHMNWFLKFEVDGVDMYPKIRELYKNPKIYKTEKIRLDILKYFGYFSTESPFHTSEYLPYFRKNKELIDHYIKRRWVLKEVEKAKKIYDDGMIKRWIGGKEKIKIRKSILAAPKIINAMTGGDAVTINGNVRNNGLIPNLYKDSVVEVPTFVDKNGIHPLYVGDLPPQCAALCMSNINVQSLIVEAALTGNVNTVHQALMVDPVTSSICTLDDIKKMSDEMLKAEKKWLPEFE